MSEVQLQIKAGDQSVVCDDRSLLEVTFRAADLLLIVLTAPSWMGILGLSLLATWLESGRPLFFLQRRMGCGQRPFNVYKIRTMRSGIPSPTGALFAGWTYTNDPRVTRVGRVLRSYRIDEIPQLWNVLRGDMGLVGPRPEPWDVAVALGEQIPEYHARHRVRPGLTGECQISSIYYDFGTIEKSRAKLQLDLRYVRERCWSRRLWILWRTGGVLRAGAGMA